MRIPIRTLTRSITDSGGEARPSNGENGLGLCVIATTHTGTQSALTAARDLSLGLEPRIVLFAAHVVPYGQALDHPADVITFTEDRFRKLAEGVGTDVLVRVFVCRSEVASLERLLPRGATVLVGGTSRRWWRTREQRLARYLADHGHGVLFIDTKQRRTDSPRGSTSA